ncbi:MAG TPA: C45 family peptidase [Bacillota bacterium]|nr:C45 family peptidase [Bacillota bacterium]
MTRKKLAKVLLLLAINLVILVSLSGVQIGAEVKPVTITDEGTYFNAVLDFRGGLTHRQMGVEYARQILKSVPEYEALMDSYITEMTMMEEYYQMGLGVARLLKSKIPQDYLDEIEGMAQVFSGGVTSLRGDQKLSLDEVFFFNLLPDIARPAHCSALGVFDWASATHQVMAGRNLDWPGGSQNQACKLQAVVTIREKCKTLYLIGYLGFQGVISGVNEYGVYAGILNSDIATPYTPNDKNSYPMDLRYALENRTTVNGVANYMTDSSRNYTYDHLIFLADPRTAGVVENNFNGSPTVRRALRTSTSLLNPGVSWWFPKAVATVNSFILAGNYNNHTQDPQNTARWSSFQHAMLTKGPVITREELKEIMSFDNGDGPGLFETGDIYNVYTQQSMVFTPETMRLDIYFHPRQGGLDSDPIYQTIKLK